jgi:hypothetical protein
VAAGYATGTQLLNRREMDEAAKNLGEKARTGNANFEDYFELGTILARKRLFTQAVKTLQKAVKVWDADTDDQMELAQVPLIIDSIDRSIDGDLRSHDDCHYHLLFVIGSDLSPPATPLQCHHLTNSIPIPVSITMT